MKQFLITYTFHPEAGTLADWTRQVDDFIRQLQADAELAGRIRYRCMRATGTENYYHLAETTDDDAPRLLSERPYFKHYTEQTKRVSGGSVIVTPLETFADSDDG